MSPTQNMWRNLPLPEPGWVVGYASLMDHFDLAVPVPPVIAMVAEKYDPSTPTEGFIVLGRRRLPDQPRWSTHLELALKEEGVRLDILNGLFKAIPRKELTAYLRSAPFGKYARRIWFLFEWLTGQQLDLPDVDGRPQAVDVLDPALQVALPEGSLSRRHLVRNNLPGTPAFCPLIWRTDSIVAHEEQDYGDAARQVLASTHPDLISRAAAFLLLSDSRSSFEIEGERPSADRTRRWGQAIAEAGDRTLSIEELVRLQHTVIGDSRFVTLGLRSEGGFVGTRDRISRDPLPEHISAKPSDLKNLLEGLIAFAELSLASGINPVYVATCVAFGFVYIHPFQDGNGRTHRWLIHHILSKAGYNPAGIPFPVSAAILRHVESYREVLRSTSSRMLPLIEWTSTAAHNVEVQNETAHLYRYFDATAHAAFLFRCVAETVDIDVPTEVAYLRAFDRFEREVLRLVDMPHDTIELLFRFLEQHGGTLSNRARNKEFSAFTPEEAAHVESLYAAIMAETRTAAPDNTQ